MVPFKYVLQATAKFESVSSEEDLFSFRYEVQKLRTSFECSRRVDLCPHRGMPGSPIPVRMFSIQYGILHTNLGPIYQILPHLPSNLSYQMAHCARCIFQNNRCENQTIFCSRTQMKKCDSIFVFFTRNKNNERGRQKSLSITENSLFTFFIYFG